MSRHVSVGRKRDVLYILVTVQTVSWTALLSAAPAHINADAATGSRTELEVKRNTGRDNFLLFILIPKVKHSANSLSDNN